MNATEDKNWLWSEATLLVFVAFLLPKMATCQVIVFTDSARVFMPGVVSTPNADVKITFSPDGKYMLWGGIDWIAGKTDWDIWMSVSRDGKWSTPVVAPFCSDSNDFDPYFTTNGTGLYFFSNRKGGYGGDDIYFAGFTAATSSFTVPVNLGAAINTSGDEWAPVTNLKNTRLLFSSNGRGGRGGQDLFIARLKRGTVRRVRNLGQRINSLDDDFDAAFLSEDKVIFTSTRLDKNKPMLFFIRLDGSEKPLLLDQRVNSSTYATFGPSVNPNEKHVLYFSSNHSNGVGRTHIYRIPFRLLPD